MNCGWLPHGAALIRRCEGASTGRAAGFSSWCFLAQQGGSAGSWWEQQQQVWLAILSGEQPHSRWSWKQCAVVPCGVTALASDGRKM